MLNVDSVHLSQNTNISVSRSIGGFSFQCVVLNAFLIVLHKYFSSLCKAYLDVEIHGAKRERTPSRITKRHFCAFISESAKIASKPLFSVSVRFVHYSLFTHYFHHFEKQ